MKKGCFLSVIVILTIVVIGVFYIVRFHGEDLLEIGKDKLIEFAESKIENDIKSLQEGVYTDSLKIAVKKYFSNIENLDVETGLKTIEEFSDNIEVIFMDSKIDSAEFDFITNILMKHEQRKEN